LLPESEQHKWTVATFLTCAPTRSFIESKQADFFWEWNWRKIFTMAQNLTGLVKRGGLTGQEEIVDSGLIACSCGRFVLETVAYNHQAKYGCVNRVIYSRSHYESVNPLQRWAPAIFTDLSRTD
jgi:hypothetical protein